MQLLERRIQDQRFLELIRKALKAGYLISGNKTDILTPQGSVISPILANIFLHELDVYVEQLKKAYDSPMTGYRPRSKVSLPKYSYLLRKVKLDSVRSREMKYATVSVDKTYADHSKRLMYVRYGVD